MTERMRLYIVEDTEARFSPVFYLTTKVPSSPTQEVVDSFEVIAPKRIVDWLIESCESTKPPRR
ncbi:MAG: hypothetical protein DRJ38_00440 [Thermoprotei archaeon]|nr:MAG: hypothetical protein DRJ38_00440 [Thermoprotei archaeon]